MPAEINALIQGLNSSQAEERRFAAEDLGDLRAAEAVPHLVRVLDDVEVSVREAAADALVRCADADGARWIAALLASESVPIRNYAQEILAGIGSKALPALVSAFMDADGDIRKFALDVIGRMGPRARSAQPEVIRLLRDPNVNVAGAAAETLGLIGDSESLAPLLELFDGPTWMQCCAIQALSDHPVDEARHALATIDPAKLSPEAADFLRALGAGK